MSSNEKENIELRNVWTKLNMNIMILCGERASVRASNSWTMIAIILYVVVRAQKTFTEGGRALRGEIP